MRTTSITDKRRQRRALRGACRVMVMVGGWFCECEVCVGVCVRVCVCQRVDRLRTLVGRTEDLNTFIYARISPTSHSRSHYAHAMSTRFAHGAHGATHKVQREYSTVPRIYMHAILYTFYVCYRYVYVCILPCTIAESLGKVHLICVKQTHAPRRQALGVRAPNVCTRRKPHRKLFAETLP